MIDGKIQSLQGQQTNGIPQGSVLMDLIAEIVLGYADIRLLDLVDQESLSEFKILRYRDDYSDFCKQKRCCGKINEIVVRGSFRFKFKN